MGLFNAWKKKKELPELEAPPPVEEPSAEEHSMQPSIPAYSMEPFPEQPEMPLQTFQDVPMPPDEMRMQPPQPPEHPQEQSIAMQKTPEFPTIPEIPQKISLPQQAVEPPQMPKEALSLFQLQQMPQFKFYTAPAEGHEEHEVSEEHDVKQYEIPFDVKQELLTLPKEAKIPKQVKPHIPRTFLTVSMLMDVGEQLIHMNDDIALGKDTAFRLGDLNEQEIEKMAKWHALHQSMELRLAQMDKILFKA